MAEAHRCADALECDPTAELLDEALPLGTRSVRHGGVGDVVGADIVVVTADAIGAGGMVVDVDARGLLEAARAVEVPVWVAPAGRHHRTVEGRVGRSRRGGTGGGAHRRTVTGRRTGRLRLPRTPRAVGALVGPSVARVASTRMGEMIEFPSNGSADQGYLATGASGGPGVVVIQEWWGLVPHIKDVCDRFAAAGFVALAPDLYRGTHVSEPDEAGKEMMALELDRAGKDMSGAVDEVRRRCTGDAVGARCRR